MPSAETRAMTVPLQGLVPMRILPLRGIPAIQRNAVLIVGDDKENSPFPSSVLQYGSSFDLPLRMGIEPS